MVYKGEDIALDIMMTTERVVQIIATEHGLTFDAASASFASSRAYAALARTNTLMWAESAEYIADCCFEEVP
jgi:hypothetical protein